MPGRAVTDTVSKYGANRDEPLEVTRTVTRAIGDDQNKREVAVTNSVLVLQGLRRRYGVEKSTRGGA